MVQYGLEHLSRGRPRDGLLLFGAVLNQHALHDGCVGFALRFHEGSAIDVHRGRDVRVTHEFLLYAERRTSLVEPSAVAVTQRMPADGSVNLGTRRSSLEHLLPERTRIVRFVCSWAGKDPVSLRLWAKTLPLQKNSGDVRIQRQFVLRTFGFQLRNLAASVAFPHLHDQAFEVDQTPAQAHRLADTKPRAPCQKDHTAIGMVELIEQRSKFLLRQNAGRFEALADSFEFD